MKKIKWLPRWLAAILTLPVAFTLLGSILVIPEIFTDPTINTGTPGIIGGLIVILTSLTLEAMALIFLIKYIKDYKTLE